MESTVFFTFEQVASEKVDVIWPHLVAILDDVAATWRISWVETKQIMEQLINAKILHQASIMESRPNEAIAAMAIGNSNKYSGEKETIHQHKETIFFLGDFLYGNTETDFELRFNSEAVFQALKDEPSDFWLNLLHKYIINAPRVLVKCKFCLLNKF